MLLPLDGNLSHFLFTECTITQRTELIDQENFTISLYLAFSSMANGTTGGEGVRQAHHAR